MDELQRKRAALQKSIQADEEKLKQCVQEFGELVKQKVSLGNYVSRKPYSWLTYAFVFGVLVGVGLSELSG